MAEFNGKQGVWRTIGGRKVFIADGEDLPTAMKNSGKFNKKYTKEDIEPIRVWYSKNPKGYKLGDYYLLKDYYGLRTTEKYNWIISVHDYAPLDYIARDKQLKNGEIINVNNFKEGKEKLIEIANNKKLRGTNKVIG